MNILKKILPFNLKREIKENLGVPSLHWSLNNLKKKNFDPKFIVDVGAYEGFWALETLEIFPGSRILMIEAQAKKQPALEVIANAYQNIDYKIALLSSEDGVETPFLENETGSQVIFKATPGMDSYFIVSQKLDTVLSDRGSGLPDFLKLDVQNHELEVLAGAEKSLAHAEVCLLEVSLLNFGNDVPLLAEVVAFMDKRQFQAYDISQFMRRPLDKALFQIDMFFVKKNSKIIEDNRW